MLSKPALTCSFLFLGATGILLYSCCRILAFRNNEKDGLVLLTLSLGNSRRDLLGSVQSLASHATEVGGIATSFMPMITSVAGDAASQATAGVSKVLSGVASLETAALSGILAANYTVGTKYACSASSCSQHPSLEVLLCFALVMTLISAVAFAMSFFLPRMKLVFVACSVLALLLFIVFTACVVSITEIAALAGESTFFRVQKGDVFGTSLCALGGAILLAFSAIGMLYTSLNEPQTAAVIDTGLNKPRRVPPTWARPTGRPSKPKEMVTNLHEPVNDVDRLAEPSRVSTPTERRDDFSERRHEVLAESRMNSRRVKLITLPAITEVSSDRPWPQRAGLPVEH